MLRADGLHLGCGGHFKVEAAAHGGAQQFQVPELDVAAVLAQVNGDPIGSAQFCQQRQSDWIGFLSPTGLAHIGDVIDIHAKAGHGRDQ